MEELLESEILALLKRKRRVALRDIIEWLKERVWLEEPRKRELEAVIKVLTRLEIGLALVRHREQISPAVWRYTWYWAQPLRELVIRRPGRRLTTREISEQIGIPVEETKRVADIAVERGWLKKTLETDIYQVPEKIYRVQKMRAWKTGKRPELYRVKFEERQEIPTQLILEGYAEEKQAYTLAKSVHGAVRIVVYTAEPKRWPDSRLERIMRALFAQEGITLEIYSKKPGIRVSQAYEVREVDIDEKPSELDIDEVDVWLYVAKAEGYTLIYHYIRRPTGWTYERMKA